MVKKDLKKVKQGKRNQINGRLFELKVRSDLESKGWIVSKWQNNVEFENSISDWAKKDSFIFWAELSRDKWKEGLLGMCDGKYIYQNGKLVSAKQGPFRKTSTGFPDFIAYKLKDFFHKGKIEKSKKEELLKLHSEIVETNAGKDDWYWITKGSPDIIFVECKSNGYLSKEEKEKASWYLEKNFCSKFLVAKKKKVGRKVEVEYVEFKKDD